MALGIVVSVLGTFGGPEARAADTASLVGKWERRDASFVIGETGLARLYWRTDWCGPGVLGPCDQFDKGVLMIGAYADLRLDHIDASEPLMSAHIESVTRTGLFEVGPATVARLSTDLLELRQGLRSVQLCRLPRDLMFCDEGDMPLSPGPFLSGVF